MKKLMTALLCVFSLSALAHDEKVSFSYSGIEGWGRVYYACSYVEAQTEKHLKALGATHIDVDCRGGIEHDRMWPVSVTATFDVPALQGNEVATVKTIKGDRRNPACGVNVAIFKAVLPKFSNVTVVKKDDRCAFASSNYSYTLNVLE